MFGKQTWIVLVNKPVGYREQMFRGCKRCWNHEKMVGSGTHGSAVWVRIHMLPPLSEKVAFSCRHCAEVMIKHHCWRCLGRVNAACDKFDNRLYVLKTGYRLETGFIGLPVTIRTTLHLTAFLSLPSYLHASVRSQPSVNALKIMQISKYNKSHATKLDVVVIVS